jgi:hypothetical protein
VTAAARPVLPAGTGALSVRRPWAGLIVAGHKPVENRTWVTRYRGLLHIHAGRVWDVTGAVAALTLTDCDGDWLTLDGADRHLTAFGYLGTVTLVDVHQADGRCCQPWGGQPDTCTPRVYHWELANPVRLADPIPGRGYLGVYRAPPEALAAA